MVELFTWESLNWNMSLLYLVLVMGFAVRIMNFRKKLIQTWVVVIIFFMLVMILFVHQLDWAILISRRSDADVFSNFLLFLQLSYLVEKFIIPTESNLQVAPISLQRLVLLYGAQYFKVK